MFLYVVIFQQMTYFFAVQTSPNMIGLTVKNIIIKKQLIFFFSSWCSILYYFRGLRIGWFTDVPPETQMIKWFVFLYFVIGETLGIGNLEKLKLYCGLQSMILAC
jgi:hypothetical protein